MHIGDSGSQRFSVAPADGLRQRSCAIRRGEFHAGVQPLEPGTSDVDGSRARASAGLHQSANRPEIPLAPRRLRGDLLGQHGIRRSRGRGEHRSSGRLGTATAVGLAEADALCVGHGTIMVETGG
jgi:hypothetical protein